jgi:AraC-like DNA-binding protein
MRKTVGTSPKLLARIFRFQSVISLVKDCAEVNWTQVAHHCGYYDQAHMIREFHLFSNATPRDYLKHRDEDENHIIVD